MKISGWVKYLQQNRYAAPGKRVPIGKSKVYADLKSGIFVVADEKNVTQDELARYIMAAGLVRLEGNAQIREDLQRRRAEGQAGLIEIRREREKFELDRLRGRYIEKDEVHLTCATKCAALEAGLKNTVRINAVDWIIKTGGDPKHAKMLIALMYSEIDALLGEFGNMDEINVVVAKTPSDLPWWPVAVGVREKETGMKNQRPA